MHINRCITYETTINKKEVTNLKENKEEYIVGFEGKRGKRKNDVIML